MYQSVNLGDEIRVVVVEIIAQDALVQQLEGPARIVCRKRLAAAFARLEGLQARLPNAPRTFADLVLLAELAYWWTPKASDGKLLALAGDAVPNEHFAARLIAAVLTMAGPRPNGQPCRH